MTPLVDADNDNVNISVILDGELVQPESDCVVDDACYVSFDSDSMSINIDYPEGFQTRDDFGSFDANDNVPTEDQPILVSAFDDNGDLVEIET